ncbi:MAG: fatty acid--CoA ligase family protein [Alphaproteobacteria bacterium]|nr:fatty acid--CoA ligase family protein [Alphaproteobacteria bacterium]
MAGKPPTIPQSAIMKSLPPTAERKHGIELTNTLAAIAVHALDRQDAPAILSNNVTISYQTLWQDLCCTIAALGPVVPDPDSLAAVEWTSPYHHVLLLLALEHFGVPTASYRAQEITGDFQRLFEQADFIAAATISPHAKPKTILCDAFWWEQTLSNRSAEAALNSSKPAENHRIACSSGTTGLPKFMMRSRAQSEFRFAQSQSRLELRQDSRLVLPATFAFQANYLAFISCLRAGGLSIFSGDTPVFDVLRDLAATHLIAIPMEFLALKRINFGEELPPGLKALIIGGSLSPADRTTWKKVCPTGKLIEVYATNEAGAIAEMQPDKSGKVIPGIEVEIVDDDDQPLPYGQTGHIRVRGLPCASGYLFEDRSYPERFRDGWFYPGDLAILDDATHLRLLGRDDELLNVRGFKIPAVAIEEIVNGLPEIQDCCATTVLDPLDDGAIWLGVVFSANAEFSDIQHKLKSLLPVNTDIHIYTADEIPRGPSGKIQRHKIIARLRQHIQSTAQQQP